MSSKKDKITPIDLNKGKVVEEKSGGLGFFEKYLTIWVALCIVVGVLIGVYLPQIPETLDKFTYAQVSIPVAILIWLMIYPMMLKIDFTSIKNAAKQKKGLAVTCGTNWLIKPFSMYAISYFFLLIVFKNIIPSNLAKEYLAGAVLLGAAPCTAMVFVWSHLTKGNAAYTLVQVAVNDIILLVGFVPIVALLLGVTDVAVPMDTLFLSVVLFVIIPFVAGYFSRTMIIKKKGLDYFENEFLTKFNGITVVGLLLTLVILFAFQGQKIIDNPIHIALIAIPLTIQTFFIFFLAYLWAKVWKLPHDIAAPGAMIGASNFFELAVAVAIALFGLNSGAALATVVGVLVEVPVMLALVAIANKTKHWFNN
ncbi:arsenical-resistance protein [uncultured Clostridium sp.]|nr:arsenical-resistance protein [uncultured Clostridium sp.]